MAVVIVAGLGWMTIKRSINGNSDFAGNHRLWAKNWIAPYQPAGRDAPIPEDPDAYPPITYLLYAPLGALPVGVASAIWYALNLWCSAWLWRWCLRQSGPDPQARICRLAAVALLFPAWLSAILLGQNTLVLMVLVLAAYSALEHNQTVRASVGLTLAILLKVMPVLAVVPLLFVPRWRVIGLTAALGFAIVVGAGSLYFGSQTNWMFHQRWLNYAVLGSGQPADPMSPDTLRGSLRYHNQSWEAVSARWLMPVPLHAGKNETRINVVQVSAATWRTVYLLGQITLVIGFLTGLAGLRLGNAAASEYLPRALQFTIPTLLLISPILWSHYVIWCVWPLAEIIRQARTGRRLACIVVVAWGAALLGLASPWLRGVGVQLGALVLLWIALAAPAWTTLFRWLVIRQSRFPAESYPHARNASVHAPAAETSAGPPAS